jgi:hypothetical protein
MLKLMNFKLLMLFKAFIANIAYIFQLVGMISIVMPSQILLCAEKFTTTFNWAPTKLIKLFALYVEIWYVKILNTY